MEAFHVSRIHTPQGIFKVSGYHSQSLQAIKITSLEIMGTDGWIMLAIEASQTLIEKLVPDLLSHLNDN